MTRAAPIARSEPPLLMPWYSVRDNTKPVPATKIQRFDVLITQVSHANLR